MVLCSINQNILQGDETGWNSNKREQTLYGDFVNIKDFSEIFLNKIHNNFLCIILSAINSSWEHSDNSFIHVFYDNFSTRET